jgi:hypothetical protein
MDYQAIINIVGGAVLTAIGWFSNELWNATKELRKDLHQIEKDLPTNYVRRDEFADAVRRIEDMLGKIFDKLDGKVDK